MFGSPGTAVALLHAAKKLGYGPFLQVEVQALTTVTQLPRSQWRITDYGLCHGVSGVAMCFLQAAELTGISEFNDFAITLLNDVASANIDEYALGYRANVATLGYVDDPGFLTGVAGIALAFLAAETKQISWLRVLGLC